MFIICICMFVFKIKITWGNLKYQKTVVTLEIVWHWNWELKCYFWSWGIICLILFQMLLYFELVVLVKKKVFQFLCHFVVYLFTDYCCLGNNLCTYSPNCVPLMIYVHCSPYWPLLFIPVQFLCWLQISNFTHSHFILHFLCYYN